MSYKLLTTANSKKDSSYSTKQCYAKSYCAIAAQLNIPDWCGNPSPYTSLFCSKIKGHDGSHLACMAMADIKCSLDMWN